jgi:hypothetical protein
MKKPDAPGNVTPDLPPRSSKIRQIPFDAQCVELVAEVLGAEAQTAPFRLPGGAVYQIVAPDAAGKPSTMLTIWPSIRRVDAISASSTVVFTDVVTVDLVDEVEVQFRRANRDYLIVARGGKVIVRA